MKLHLWLFCFFIFFLVSSFSWAGSFTAYGPIQIERGAGKPQAMISTFVIKNPNTIYTLVAHNGGKIGGRSKISSAVVDVNGVDVFLPNDFNLNVNVLSQDVSILSSNTLTVLQHGKPGALLDIELVGQDDDFPFITASVLPIRNSYGWHHVDPVVTFSCEDTTSKIVFCTKPIVVSAEGDNQTFIGLAIDEAGNESSVEVTINLDKTPPTIQSQQIPYPNAAGWNNTDVNIEFFCNDSLSGVDSCSGPVILTNDGIGVELEGISVDRAGNTSLTSKTINIDKIAPSIHVISPMNGLNTTDNAVEVTGFLEELNTIKLFSVNGVNIEPSSDNQFISIIELVEGQNTIEVRAIDIADNESFVTLVVSKEKVIPDYTVEAPPIKTKGSPSLLEMSSFLYEGDNPIQIGVDVAGIDELSAAVVRGKVINIDGIPMKDVNISIKDHSGYGYTLTREDGMFDMVINGGGWLTVRYEKSGYFPVQRKENANRLSFNWVTDVVMTSIDLEVTTIDLSQSQLMQVATGSRVEDEDGSRTSVLLFQAGTTATLELPDGSKAPIDILNVRSTEYTVGENGMNAMPGVLPPTSAYTYAAELSVDEAMEVGAKHVHFSKPVYNYVDNFIEFPVGGIVPSGYFDADADAWIASNNGVVIKIIGVDENNLAEIDVDGSGNSASSEQLLAFGFTTQELQKLTSLYDVGKSLWRVPLTHFSTVDFNWPIRFPVDAPLPPSADGGNTPFGGSADPTGGDHPNGDKDKEDSPCLKQGSIIECQNQVLGERIKIPSANISLNYRSDRVKGRKTSYTIDIPLSTDNIEYVVEIGLAVYVAGTRYEERFSPAPYLKHRFEWNGMDLYGREVQGREHAKIEITYYYDLQYVEPSISKISFGRVGAPDGLAVGNVRSSTKIGLRREYTREIGSFSTIGTELGLWSLENQHSFDVKSKVLLRGDGTRKSTGKFGRIINSIYNRNYTYDPKIVTYGRDGNMYFAGNSPSCYLCYYVVKATPDGQLSQVIYSRSIHFSGVVDLAVTSNGTIYILMQEGIYRYTKTNGLVLYFNNTPSGGGVTGEERGDGGLIQDATVLAKNIAVDSIGNLYIVDKVSGGGNNLIRKVDVQDIITTIAGNGSLEYTGDGGAATQAGLVQIGDIEVNGQGEVYFLQGSRSGQFHSYYIGQSIRRITVDGQISTVAGQWNGVNIAGNGDLATSGRLQQASHLSLDEEGGIYYSERIKVNYITPSGVLVHVAGGRTDINALGDGGLAENAYISIINAVAINDLGSLYIADSANDRIRIVTPALSTIGIDEIPIVEDGGEHTYIFNKNGLHLRTIDNNSGKSLYSFHYDSQELLIGIEDLFGNFTSITRSVDGVAYEITSSDGVVTNLITNDFGQLTSVLHADGSQYQMGYTNDGLLTTFSQPSGNQSIFSYDELGYLINDENAAGGGWTLERLGLTKGYKVNAISSEGRTTEYLTERDLQGNEVSTIISPSGLHSVSRKYTNGLSEYVSQEGVVNTIQQSPDARFGMIDPYESSNETILPSGLKSVITTNKTLLLNTQDNPFSVRSNSIVTNINGRAYVSEFDGAEQVYTLTSPESRVLTIALNENLKTSKVDTTYGVTVTYGYDLKGRLISNIETDGISTREVLLDYNGYGYLDSITDSLGRATTFDTDIMGRVVKQVLPGARSISYTYDNNGNLTSITPPGRTAHMFIYNDVNEEHQYTPPAIGTSNLFTRYYYNLDKDITQVLRPDGSSIDFSYDFAGRLSSLDIARGKYVYSYGNNTAQLSSITSPEGDGLSFTYDGFLPISESWIGAITGTISRNYNSDYWVTALSVNGVSIDYAYDNDGLLTQTGNLVLEHDQSSGLLLRTILGNMSTNYAYNGFAEVDSFTANYGGAEIYSTQFTRDALGRIVTKMETTNGVTHHFIYDYDLAGRLVNVTKDNISISQYIYDDNGNRIGGFNKDGAINGIYDTQDRLTNYRTINYDYTLNGELLTKRDGATTVSNYDYDELGNLRAVSLADGSSIEYIIDSKNRRVGKKVDGILIQGFLYQDQLSPVAELDGYSNVIARFVYGSKANIPDYMIKNGITYHIASDHLGSPILITNVQTGVIEQHMEYDEFGNVIQDSNPGFQPFGFAGGIYDQHAKLIRFGARDYDPETGRWTNKDPIRFAGGDTNLYGYVLNDPINWIDENGLKGTGISAGTGMRGQSRASFGNPHGIPVLRPRTPPVRSEPTSQSPFRPNSKHNPNILRDYINNLPQNNLRRDRTGPPEYWADKYKEFPKKRENQICK